MCIRDSFGGVHGEFIVDVAMSLAFDLRKRYLVISYNEFPFIDTNRFVL